MLYCILKIAAGADLTLNAAAEGNTSPNGSQKIAALYNQWQGMRDYWCVIGLNGRCYHNKPCHPLKPS